MFSCKKLFKTKACYLDKRLEVTSDLGLAQTLAAVRDLVHEVLTDLSQLTGADSQNLVLGSLELSSRRYAEKVPSSSKAVPAPRHAVSL